METVGGLARRLLWSGEDSGQPEDWANNKGGKDVREGQGAAPM